MHLATTQSKDFFLLFSCKILQFIKRINVYARTGLFIKFQVRRLLRDRGRLMNRGGSLVK